MSAWCHISNCTACVPSSLEQEAQHVFYCVAWAAVCSNIIDACSLFCCIQLVKHTPEHPHCKSCSMAWTDCHVNATYDRQIKLMWACVTECVHGTEVQGLFAMLLCTAAMHTKVHCLLCKRHCLLITVLCMVPLPEPSAFAFCRISIHVPCLPGIQILKHTRCWEHDMYDCTACMSEHFWTDPWTDPKLRGNRDIFLKLSRTRPARHAYDDPMQKVHLIAETTSMRRK